MGDLKTTAEERARLREDSAASGFHGRPSARTIRALDDLDTLRAENARLRAALRNLIDAADGEVARAADIAKALAAHVRKERCLVAEAVGMGTGITISRTSERVPGTTGMWDVYATRRPDVPGEHYAYGVPASDVPATLARLLARLDRAALGEP